MRFRASMKAAVSARLADAGRLRSARRSPRASAIRSTRRDRPVTSATASCPKCCTIWSSADGTGGSAASFSISASRRATASWQSTGLPSPSNTGRENRLPLSSVNGSWSCTGKAWARNSMTVSLAHLLRQRGEQPSTGETLNARAGRYFNPLRRSGQIRPISQKIMKSTVETFELYNGIRNNESLAHDNSLVESNEARFIFDTVVSMLRFLKTIEGNSFGA